MSTDDQEGGEEWVAKLRALIDTNWDQRCVVTSNDVDGLLSAMLVCELTGARLIGFYVNWALVLFDGATADDARDALWVDLDVLGDIRCIGNHLLHGATTLQALPGRNELSVNLNEMYGQCKLNSFKKHSLARGSKDKMPFSTVCMLVYALRDRLQTLAPTLDLASMSFSDTEHNGMMPSLLSLVAHADSTYNVVQLYAENCENWVAQHFSQAPHMKLLLDAKYYTDDHRRLLALLARVDPSRQYFSGDLPTTTTTTTTVTHDYRYQTLYFPGSKDPSISLEWLNCEWMPVVQSLIDTLASVSRWRSLATNSEKAVGKITSVLRGVDESIRSDPCGVVPAQLADDGVFSHAIIFASQVKVTRRFRLCDMADAWRNAALKLASSLGASLQLLHLVEPPRIVRIKSGAPYDIYIGSVTRLWNGSFYSPSRAAECWTNAFLGGSDPASDYRADLACSPFVVENLWRLAGQRLGCWCDVLDDGNSAGVDNVGGSVGKEEEDREQHDARQCHGSVLIEAFCSLIALCTHHRENRDRC